MNKKIFVGVAVVVILGVIVWVLISSNKDKQTLVAGEATVSTTSITNITSTAGAIFAGGKIINWQTNNYPANAGVNINLIKKISDSPIEFTFVRAIATNTSNDGEEAWVPQVAENTGNLYVEVTCSNDYQFQAGCSLSSEPIKVN